MVVCVDPSLKVEHREIELDLEGPYRTLVSSLKLAVSILSAFGLITW
jgi:hypothetical protein